MKKYVKGSFRGGQNTINLITYNKKTVIPEKIQKYKGKWYFTYPLHPGPD